MKKRTGHPVIALIIILVLVVFCIFIVLGKNSSQSNPKATPLLPTDTVTAIPTITITPSITISPTITLTPTRTLIPTKTIWASPLINGLTSSGFSCVSLICKLNNATVTISGHTITIYVKDALTDSDLASPVNAIGIAYPGIPRMVNMDYQTVMGMGMSVDNPDNSYTDNDWEGAHITTHIHWDATAGATDITVIITITD